MTASPRILIVSPSWVGDAVMAHSLYRHLLQRYPTAQLEVLAPEWTLPLFKRMPEIHAGIAFPFGHGELKLRERYAFAKTLKGRYDQAIVLPNSLKSAFVPFFARIPKRIGFIGECRYGILNDARRLDKKAFPLMVERFVHLAVPYDAPLPYPLLKPQLRAFPDKADDTLARLNISMARRFVVFCPGAEYGSAKRWPALNFAALAHQVTEAGYSVLIVGSQKDVEIGETIQEIANSSYVFNLCGQTSLEEAIDCLAISDAVVCNDSGLMHIAAALNRPLVALYGSSSAAFTPPLTDKATQVSLTLSCSPCFKRECPQYPGKAPPCLANISSEQVWAHLKKHLSI